MTDVVTMMNVLLKLSCGHTALLHGIRSDKVPHYCFCNQCSDLSQVLDSVDDRPLLREDNGRSF